MRKKTFFLIYPLLIMGVFIVFVTSCKKDDNGDNGGNNLGIPVLTTTAVTDLTQTTAKSGGNTTSDGGATIIARGVCWSTGQTPTLSDYKTIDETGASVFSSNLSGLSPGTTYYVRAYATNSSGTGYGNTMSFTTLQGGSGSSFTDSRDGNVYKTVTIGNQVWMAENLKYLPSVVSASTNSETIPYYYVYGYDDKHLNEAKATANYANYGALYNWEASKVACPAGWHLPSDAEWTELTDYLGGIIEAYGKLKETGTTHWVSPNDGATNETGFTALPGGFRRTFATAFANLGYSGHWWSATQESTHKAWRRSMHFNSSDVIRGNYNKEESYSVRCVKD